MFIALLLWTIIGNDLPLSRQAVTFGHGSGYACLKKKLKQKGATMLYRLNEKYIYLAILCAALFSFIFMLVLVIILIAHILIFL